jgi:uncharacterized LabA/DUF88 family protein
MNGGSETKSMALFCDFENIALGVKDANYAKFDIQLVLEKLLIKGTIIVKKAYCDWSRYRDFKAAMHEASFELIDIPHVRQSGKNSADIRMVVDALDLCYTKSHVRTFVVISGDSDFSPLVSKLRENNKVVIGVGVKNSSSDLLVANCDEFIYYDDLARAKEQESAKRAQKPTRPRKKSTTAKEKKEEDAEDRSLEGIMLVVKMAEELLADRGTEDKLWGSMIKQALKRRQPGFSETYYGFKSFNLLLEEAGRRDLLRLERDEKSGGYLINEVEDDTDELPF